MPSTDTLGERIARARDAAGYSQQALADLIGMNKVTVCRIETGARNPRPATVIAIASVLGIPASELTGEDVAA